MPPATRKISYEELAKYFHLPLTDASMKLGVCTTVLKRVCRQYKIKRWPFRKIRSIDHTVEALKGFGVQLDSNENCSIGTHGTKLRLRGKLDVHQEINKLEERRTSLVLNPVRYAEVAKEQDRDRRKIMKKLSKRLKRERNGQELINSNSSTPSPPHDSPLATTSVESPLPMNSMNPFNTTIANSQYGSLKGPIFPNEYKPELPVPILGTQNTALTTPNIHWNHLPSPQLPAAQLLLPSVVDMEIEEENYFCNVSRVLNEKKLPVLEPSFEKVQMFGICQRLQASPHPSRA